MYMIGRLVLLALFLIFFEVNASPLDVSCPKIVNENSIKLAQLLSGNKVHGFSMEDCKQVISKKSQKFYIALSAFNWSGSNVQYLILYNKINRNNEKDSSIALASYAKVGSNTGYLIISKIEFINNEVTLVGNLPPGFDDLNSFDDPTIFKKQPTGINVRITYSFENGALIKKLEQRL